MSDAQDRADAYNKHYPVGTTVLYWPRGAYRGEPRLLTTRAPASVLSGHSVVLWATEIPGCLSISHCTPVSVPSEPGSSEGA